MLKEYHCSNCKLDKFEAEEPQPHETNQDVACPWCHSVETFQIPTDAAVVIRENFHPNPVVARETIKRTKALLAQMEEDQNRLQNLEEAARLAAEFSEYIGTWHESTTWQKKHIALRKALAKLGLHINDALLDYDEP